MSYGCADTVYCESGSYKFSPDCFLCSLAHTVHLAHVITEKAALQEGFIGKKEAESAAENPQKRGANLVQNPMKYRKSVANQWEYNPV